MPLQPLDVVSTPGADYFGLSWKRPPDASVVGYQISYGYQSGVYTFVLNVGDVLTYTISPLPYSQNVYAVVQSYDGALSPVLSAPSPEQTRLFPVQPASILLGVPDAIAPNGGVNDLFWGNPDDVNLKGQRVYRDAVLIDTVLAPFSSYQDTVGVNGVSFTYDIVSIDFSNPPRTGPTVTRVMTSAKLLGSSPPSAPTGLEGEDSGVSVILNWKQNPESNLSTYEVRYAPTLALLASTPTVVDVGLVTSWVISGFSPSSDVYVQVFAKDNGVNPDLTTRAPYYSLPSNTYSRVITQGGITTAFALQTDSGADVNFVFNLLPSVEKFELQLDGVPTFDSVNLMTQTRYILIEDLVLLNIPQTLPPQRSKGITWYWRVRPVYPGAVNGLYHTQVRQFHTLNGVRPVTLGANTTGVPNGAVFIPSSITVSSGATTYVQGVDYDFIAPNQIVRRAGSTIADGASVLTLAEFENTLTVGINRKAETRDRMHNTLDPLYYDTASKTSNIFKWLEAMSRGAMSDYVIANRILLQGRFIDTTVPTELYSRYGGMVGLNLHEIPLPDAYAAIVALYPAFLMGGTKGAVISACEGLTGRKCKLSAFGSGAGTGWILHGPDGPPGGEGDFLFSDFEGTLPFNNYTMTLADYDDIFNYNITVENSARGIQKSVVRDGTIGLSDSLGITNIVEGSLKILADEGAGVALVDTARFSVDYGGGVITWKTGMELASGITYTVICGVFITDLIKRVLNTILPAHVNPIYTFQVRSLAQTLGLMVWEQSLYDTTDWAN